MELEREHSTPANDEIPNEGSAGGNVENLDQHWPTRIVLPIVAVAKLVVPKMEDYQGRPPSGRVATPPLTTWSSQSGSSSVTLECHLCRPLAFEII